MPLIPVKSSRKLIFGGIVLFIILGFAAISATAIKVSFSGVILILVASMEAGLIILGLIMVQNERQTSVKKAENA